MRPALDGMIRGHVTVTNTGEHHRACVAALYFEDLVTLVSGRTGIAWLGDTRARRRSARVESKIPVSELHLVDTRATRGERRRFTSINSSSRAKTTRITKVA